MVCILHTHRDMSFIESILRRFGYIKLGNHGLDRALDGGQVPDADVDRGQPAIVQEAGVPEASPPQPAARIATQRVAASPAAVAPAARPTTEPAVAGADDEERLWQEALARARATADKAPAQAAPARPVQPAPAPAQAAPPRPVQPAPAPARPDRQEAAPAARKPRRLPRPTRPHAQPTVTAAGRMSLAAPDMSPRPADLPGQRPQVQATHGEASRPVVPARGSESRPAVTAPSREALTRVLAVAKPRRRSRPLDTATATV